MAYTIKNLGYPQQAGFEYAGTTDNSADWPSVPNDTYFFDLDTKQVYYKDVAGTVIGAYDLDGGGGVITVDVATAQGLAATSGFVEGAVYRIYDAAIADGAPGSGLDDGSSGFITYAINSSQLSLDGTWSFEYENYAVTSFSLILFWDDSGSYVSADLSDITIGSGLTTSLIGIGSGGTPITYTPAAGGTGTATFLSALTSAITANVSAGSSHGWEVIHSTVVNTGDELDTVTNPGSTGVYKDIIYVLLRKNVSGSIYNGYTTNATSTNIVSLLPDASHKASKGYDLERIELAASYSLENDRFTRAYDPLWNNRVENSESGGQNIALYNFLWRHDPTETITDVSFYDVEFNMSKHFAPLLLAQTTIRDSSIICSNTGMPLALVNTEIANSTSINLTNAQGGGQSSIVFDDGVYMNACTWNFDGSAAPASGRWLILRSEFHNTDITANAVTLGNGSQCWLAESKMINDQIIMDNVIFDKSILTLRGLDSHTNYYNFRNSNHTYFPTYLTNVRGYYRKCAVTTDSNPNTSGITGNPYNAVIKNSQINLDFYCGNIISSTNSGFNLYLHGCHIVDSIFTTGVCATSQTQSSKTVIDFSNAHIKASQILLNGIDGYSLSSESWYLAFFINIKGEFKTSTFIDSLFYMDSTVMNSLSSWGVTIAGCNINNSNIFMEGNNIGSVSPGYLNLTLLDSTIKESTINNNFLTIEGERYEMTTSEGTSIIGTTINMLDAQFAGLTGPYFATITNSSLVNSDLELSGTSIFTNGTFQLLFSNVTNSIIGLISQADEPAVLTHTYKDNMTISYTSINSSSVKFTPAVNINTDRTLTNCIINNYNTEGAATFQAGDRIDKMIIIPDTGNPSLTTYIIKNMFINGSEVMIDVHYDATAGLGVGSTTNLGYAILPRISFYEIAYGQDIAWTTPGSLWELGLTQDLIAIKSTTDDLVDYSNINAPESTDTRTRTSQINELSLESGGGVGPNLNQEVAFRLKGTIMKF